MRANKQRGAARPKQPGWSENKLELFFSERDTHTSLGPGPGAAETTAVRPGADAPHPQVRVGEGEPLGWAGPGMSSLPQVWSERSGWPQRAKHSGPAAHCILAPRGRRGLALGRLGQGSAGFRGQDAHIVRSGDCRYLIASLRGCPAPLRGSRRSAARPLWSCAR